MMFTDLRSGDYMVFTKTLVSFLVIRVEWDASLDEVPYRFVVLRLDGNSLDVADVNLNDSPLPSKTEVYREGELIFPVKIRA